MHVDVCVLTASIYARGHFRMELLIKVKNRLLFIKQICQVSE